MENGSKGTIKFDGAVNLNLVVFDVGVVRFRSGNTAFRREEVHMRLRHAYSGYIYETMADGMVKVDDPKTGRSGIFTPDAKWLSGDLTYADHHMIGHIGGKTAEGATSLGTFSRRRG